MTTVHPRIEASREQIDAFCRKWNIVELALFGSVVREDFNDDSDVDVMVTFAPGVRRRAFDFLDMQAELQQMFGRKVDLVRRGTIENPYRLASIMRDLTIVYAA